MAQAGRSHRFFRTYPDREVTLPWGTAFRLPFHCYDAETLVIGGTVALDPLARWLEPEGLVPVRLRPPTGKPLGAAWLWINDYRDTNAGAYRELVVAFAAARDSFDLPLRNDVSPLAPMAHRSGLVFARWLFLDQDRAVALGREVWGFPKERGTLDLERPEGRLRCQVQDDAGREVVDIDVRRIGDAAHLAVGALRVGRALGFERTATLALSPGIAVTVVTPRDVKASRVPARLRGRPFVYRWRSSDRLRLGTRTACGGALSDLGFAPTVVQRYDPLQFVLLEDAHTLRQPPTDLVRYDDEV